MESENAIVFWNRKGEPLITVVGDEIKSERLIQIFDTDAIRKAIEKSTGYKVDNTSEEFASVELEQ